MSSTTPTRVDGTHAPEPPRPPRDERPRPGRLILVLSLVGLAALLATSIAIIATAGGDVEPAASDEPAAEPAAEQPVEDPVTTADPVDRTAPGDDHGEHAADDDHGEHAADDDHGEHAAGDEAHASADPRVIEVDMTEFAFEPGDLEVEAGTPIVLRFTNTGAVEHEAMLGDAHMQEEFAASGDHGNHGGAGHHGDVTAVTLAPGETAELEVVLDEPGEWFLGCHLPGHYDAGMVATIAVS